MSEQPNSKSRTNPQSLKGMPQALQQMLEQTDNAANAYYEAVLESCSVIDELRLKGQSYKQISAFLVSAGVQISTVTLRKYHQAIKQKQNKRPKNRQTQAPINQSKTALQAQQLSNITTQTQAEQPPPRAEPLSELPTQETNPITSEAPQPLDTLDQNTQQTKTLEDYLNAVGPDFDPNNCPPPPPLVAVEIVEE